ncbi:hypothetical protein BASA60_010981 [Batrachochytrium salamandrivorans]|nr:hypothetical protein BASA60_010981 [Batrachochytrium salamandrivorans]
MGIIKLDSFDPKDVETKSLAILKAIMIIRSLLANELKDTKSVMYELRGNSGGDVRFANSMVQLFKSDFEPFGDRYLMNKITLTSLLGAKILISLLIRASPTYFKKLPFSQELTSGSITYANTLSVGVTQFVRTGRYKGQGIEDVGIETDTVFRPRWSDLQPDSSTNTQYARIAASLARTGQKNGQSRLHFVCEPFEIENPIGKFPLEVEAAGIYEFTVFQADGKTVIAKQRSRATTKQKFSIPVSAAGSALGNNRITIVGKTAGKQVLKTIRNVRTIPDDDKYMKISTTGFTFTDLSDSVGLYQSSTTAPADGWNNLNGLWMIGNGVQYAKNIESSIEAFFIAPVGTQINIGINVALDTVPYFDFLYLSVKSSGGVEDFLLSSKSLDGKKMFNGVSGANMIVKKTIPFTTTSEKFSVALKFASDQFFQFTGVTINSFTVSAA